MIENGQILGAQPRNHGSIAEWPPELLHGSKVQSVPDGIGWGEAEERNERSYGPAETVAE